MKKHLFLSMMALMVIMTSVSCTKTLDLSDLDGGDVEGYVDMGLSVKWKTHNVGAERPEQCGGYYDYQKMKSSFDNIPTKEQAEELLANCKVKRACLKGKYGVMLTSNITNKSIFFPYGGLYNGGEFIKGKDAYLWTITSDTSAGWEAEAWIVYFNQVLFEKQYPDGIQYHVTKAGTDIRMNVRQVK